MILAILFSHLLVIGMIFLAFLALLVGFRFKKQAERDKKDYTRRHEQEMYNRIVEHDEFEIYDN